MVKLGDIAKIVRSKNAGPFTLTIDIIFETERCYDQVRDKINAVIVAEAYNIDAREVEIVHYPQAYAIKINIPRLVPSGHPGDTDVYGAQQHAPLLELELDVDCLG